MFQPVFLFFKVSLLFIVLCFLVSFLCLWFVVLFFQDLDVRFVLLFFYLDLSLGFILEFLLFIFVFLFVFLKDLVQFVFFFNLLNYFLFVLHLVFLFSLYVVVLDCLNQFIKSSVVGLSHFAQFTETGLFQLKLISVIFFYRLSFFFVLNLKSGKFMRLLFFHSAYLLNLLIIFLFFNSFSFSDFKVPFVY